MFYLGLLLTLAIAIMVLCLEEKRLRIKIMLIALTVSLGVVQCLEHWGEVKESQAQKESGILEAPSVTLLSPAQQVYPKLKIGNSKTFFVYKGPKGYPPLRVFEDTGLTIWTENGEMKLSVKIRDKNGDLIAEILANEWKTKRDKRWDRNYTPNALEVKDPTGDVVLQVVMHPDYIQFAAKMYTSGGEGVAIGSHVLSEQDITDFQQGKGFLVIAADGPRKFTVGDVVSQIETRPNPPGLPFELAIDPIFRYSSEEHFGELLEE